MQAHTLVFATEEGVSDGQHTQREAVVDLVRERRRDPAASGGGVAFLADLENVPRWNPAIEATRKTTPGPVGVGTTYRQVRASPRRTDEEFEVAVIDRRADS